MAMPMISQADREYIRDLFAENLEGDVTLELHTKKKSPILVPGREECAYCEETQQLLEEVSELSDRISLVVHDEPDNPEVPTLVYKGQNRGELRFLGIPAGNEFRNLIDAIVEVGNGESGLMEPTRQALAELKQELHLRVFVTPT